MTDELARIKREKWFYEFNLPDGTKTESYLAEEVRKIHDTRETALRKYLSAPHRDFSSALDLSCHEGFFSFVMAEYVGTVVGIDKNIESLAKAQRMADLLNQARVRFVACPIEEWPHINAADFVLCFGLLYHVENPIQIMRLVSALTRRAACIETQVLPFEVAGKVEDGNYLSQRDLNGLFGLCADYPDSKEGGLTDLALVPSVNAVGYLLNRFGFKRISFYEPEPTDYEQFVRRSRVIVYAEKA